MLIVAILNIINDLYLLISFMKEGSETKFSAYFLTLFCLFLLSNLFLFLLSVFKKEDTEKIELANIIGEHGIENINLKMFKEMDLKTKIKILWTINGVTFFVLLFFSILTYLFIKRDGYVDSWVFIYFAIALLLVIFNSFSKNLNFNGLLASIFGMMFFKTLFLILIFFSALFKWSIFPVMLGFVIIINMVWYQKYKLDQKTKEIK